MFSIAGCLFALCVAALAFRAAQATGTNVQARHGYEMDAAVHRNIAAISAACAVLFALDHVFRLPIGVPLLAVYTLIAVLYGASFLRGATGEDE